MWWKSFSDFEWSLKNCKKYLDVKADVKQQKEPLAVSCDFLEVPWKLEIQYNV